MRVLHITNKPIYPVLDGGQLASKHLMDCLIHLDYKIKNLSVETHKHKFELEEFPLEIRNKVNPEAHFIDTKITLWNVIKSLFSSESYNVKRFTDKNFEKKIINLLDTNEYDLVILESAYLLPYLNAIRLHSDAKIIVRAHNVEYRIWKQIAYKEKFFLKRIYLKKLANNLKKFELLNLSLVDGIFCISEQDMEFFKRRGVKTFLKVIPVYMKRIDNFKVNYENNDFFFVGSMSWKPNVDAVNWIVNQIAPRLKKVLPESKIHVAGSSMIHKKKKQKRSSNVIFHGKVDDMNDFMSKHGTLIVPLKTGSGVRIKILEALSLGIPIISTEKGKEGINIKPKTHYLTANLTEEFILQMKYITENSEGKESMGFESKKFIDEEYSIEIVAKKISEFIKII